MSLLFVKLILFSEIVSTAHSFWAVVYGGGCHYDYKHTKSLQKHLISLEIRFGRVAVVQLLH
jgi:hypothetical protein